MLHSVGNEISSYAERTRGTGLSTTWHYTYLSLLTGFGTSPPSLPSLDAQNFSSAGSTSQCAASSPSSVPAAGTLPLPAHPAPPHIPGDQEAGLLTPLALYVPHGPPQWQHLPIPCQTTARGLKFGFWQEGAVPEQLFPYMGKKQVTGQIPFASLILIYHQMDHTGQEYAVSRMC